MYIHVYSDHADKEMTVYKVVLLAYIKGRSHNDALLHCDEYGYLRTWKINNACKTYYRG